MDFPPSTPTITAPTMVIVGTKDPATLPEHGHEIHKMIKGSKLVALEAAHLSNIEQPKAYTEAVLNFLNATRERPWTTPNVSSAAKPRAAGFSATNAVDRSAKNRNAFNAEWVDCITRSPWREVWTRPHFDDRTRRMLVIGTMIALGRWDEFRLHVRAALTDRRFHARRHQGDHPPAGRPIAACRRAITPSAKPKRC